MARRLARGLSLALLCSVAFVRPGPVRPERTARAASAGLWQEALTAERGRAELLLSKLQDLEDLGARESCGALAEKLQVLLKQETPASQESFDTLRSANDQLDEALKELESPRSPSLPSVVPSSQLPGDPVTIDLLPPVRETDGPALIPGAAHVRVSLPLVDNSEVMWGCDLTPLYDETGSRLMSFTAFLPLGMRLAGQSRPAALPPADADLVVVEEVDLRGEADVLGIRAGDVLRAVSYVGTGPEPGWLDQMLGAKAMPMKKVMKCDGRSVEEVTEALQSNRESPDGRLVLLLERPA
ncbi:unnamed protein product [Cladocopium goreaui]|uniref:PDZ domain-containing protein n=1 Tax=Cladocopium goreaui TaxID=2562237 RepID=A0A9P1DK62_9DINO|nr:unnamed protein product [Cladocopium goreaui]